MPLDSGGNISGRSLCDDNALEAWLGWKTASEAERYAAPIESATSRRPTRSYQEQELANRKTSLQKTSSDAEKKRAPK